MRKGKIWLLGAVLIVLLLAGGCAAKEEQKQTVAQPNQAEKINAVDAFGTVKTKETQSIFLPFTALVEDVKVVEGQIIAKGDTLLSLNMDEYLSDLRKTEAALDKARYALAKLNGGEDVSESTAYLEKQKALYEAGAISRQAYLEAKWDYEMKAKDVSLQELEVQKLRSKLDLSFLSGKEIICPLNKAVAFELSYRKGDLLSGEQKLLSLANLDTLYVEADINEDFIKDVKLGAAVEIIPLANPTRSYQGKVTNISGMAFKKNGETIIPVEITLVNNDGFLLPNYNVDVKIFRE